MNIEYSLKVCEDKWYLFQDVVCAIVSYHDRNTNNWPEQYDYLWPIGFAGVRTEWVAEMYLPYPRKIEFSSSVEIDLYNDPNNVESLMRFLHPFLVEGSDIQVDDDRWVITQNGIQHYRREWVSLEYIRIDDL